MKKLYRILCITLLIAILLSACGNTVTPEASISLEEYKIMVSDFNSRIMEESVILANAGMSEYNYWKAYSSLPMYGELDYQKMAEAAMEWLSENSDADAETVKAAYDELIVASTIEAINKMPNREIDLIFRFVKDIY